MTRRIVTMAYMILSVGSAYGQAPTTAPIREAEQFIQACEHGDAKAVAQLVKEKPQLMYVRRTTDGATPLHLAKNAAVAAVLLDNGADIEATDTQNKDTPLHWALDRELWGGKSDTAAYLIDQGAQTDDILCLCSLGDLAKIKAVVQKDPSLVNFVRIPEDILGGTPLQVAVEYDHNEVVEFLLDHGANVNAVRDTSALHYAAWFDRIDIAKTLLAHGAKLEIIERQYHETPLGWAVYGGQTKMVKFLLSRGAKAREMDVRNAINGAKGQNNAGTGATKADYKQIEQMLHKAMAK
jgi:ankyrin repeat protein